MDEDAYEVYGNPLHFEEYNMVLSDRHYMLALYCILSMRPKHKEISRLLWLFINDRDGQIFIPRYISRYAEEIYFELLYSNTDETKSNTLSILNSKHNNNSFKGTILAINVDTKETIELTGLNEMKAYGFTPNAVYQCVNDRASAYTHKGYVFVRIVGDI